MLDYRIRTIDMRRDVLRIRSMCGIEVFPIEKPYRIGAFQRKAIVKGDEANVGVV